MHQNRARTIAQKIGKKIRTRSPNNPFSQIRAIPLEPAGQAHQLAMHLDVRPAADLAMNKIDQVHFQTTRSFNEKNIRKPFFQTDPLLIHQKPLFKRKRNLNKQTPYDPADEMTKITFVWNSDPNEGSAPLPLIRTLSKILAKQGHEIRIVKVPFAITAPGMMRLGKSFFEARAAQLNWYKNNFLNTLVIDTHTTPDSGGYWDWLLSLKGIKKIPSGRNRERALQMMFDLRPVGHFFPQMYVLELPAKYKTSNETLARMAGKPLEQLEPHARKYFERQTDSRASQKAGYFSDALARSIAAGIGKLNGISSIPARTPLTRKQIRIKKKTGPKRGKPRPQ